jgi:regulator of protease activity HflC (stomatin/prohibitin superfamily)
VEKIVRPTSRSVVRAVLARHPVTEIYSGARGQIVNEINERLRASFARSYIVLSEALVKDIKFSQRFQEAIEQKQVAQQEVQRMRYVLDETDKQRQQKIIQAEGEAESIRLKAQALAQNPQLVEWEYVQKLSDRVPTVITDGRTILNMSSAPAAAAAP